MGALYKNTIINFKKLVDSFKMNWQIEALEARIHQLAPPPVKPPTIVKEDKAIAGSCEELRIVDPSSESGVYRIDPDGTDNGDDPITVYCNMTTGSTIVSHDSEGLVLVPDCIGDGCFKKTIVYQVNMQISWSFA